MWKEQYHDDATASGGLAGNSWGGGAEKGPPRPQILEATVPKAGEGWEGAAGREER